MAVRLRTSRSPIAAIDGFGVSRVRHSTDLRRGRCSPSCYIPRIDLRFRSDVVWRIFMIEVVEHGRIRELRLARPPANALSPDLLSELASRVNAAPGEGAAAIVLSGSAGMFTGGLDVPLLLGLDREGMERALALFFDAMEALAGSEIPVAAAITGHSPAGGAVLSLFCDWRVMASGSFVIGFNEVRIGIPIPSVVADALVRVVGERRAEELCQTGRLLAPDEALAVGRLGGRGCACGRVVPTRGPDAAQKARRAALESLRRRFAACRRCSSGATIGRSVRTPEADRREGSIEDPVSDSQAALHLRKP